jgi:hypothetical protein
MTLVDEIDFELNRVDTDDLMAIVCETTGRDGADVAQSENTDLQDALLPRGGNAAHSEG